jgi:hypothetical protein
MITSDDAQAMQPAEIRAVVKSIKDFSPLDFENYDRSELVSELLEYVDNFHGFRLLNTIEQSSYFEDGPLIFHQALDALQYAAYWVYTRCGEKSSNSSNFRVDAAAVTLLDQAESYAHIGDILSSALGPWSIAKKLSDKTIQVSHKADLEPGIDVANRKIAGNSLLNQQPKSTFAPKRDPLYDLIRGLRKHNQKLQIPSRAFHSLVAEFKEIAFCHWQYPIDSDLGGYTFADLRQFWATLMALVYFHQNLIRTLPASRGILVKRRAAWISDVSRKSGLPKAIVEGIIDDLTYQPALYTPNQPGENRKIPYIASQPFFTLRDDVLALSNTTVLLSNIEPLILDLLNVIRHDNFDSVTRNNESVWLTELTAWLTDRGFNCYGPFNVNHSGKMTNLDLLIVDHADQFAICCELKWLKPLDSLKDAGANDKELLEGCDQAKTCLDWINSDISHIKKRVPEVDWTGYYFEALVVSRNNLGGSRIHNKPVPLVNLAIMEAVLGDPHHRSLRDFYLVTRHRSYRARPGVHYALSDFDEQYGGWRVIGKNMRCLSTDRPWRSDRDIKFPPFEL